MGILLPPPVMPSWSSYYLEPDLFGQPRQGLLSETEETRRQWIAAAQQHLKALFNDAVDRFGEDNARRLFDVATKRGHGKHGPRRAGLPPDLDWQLLAAYEVEKARGTPTRTIPRLVAENFSTKGRQFGNLTTASIESRLRRLLRERKRCDKERVESYRGWCESYKAATGKEPEGTLLASTDTK